MHQIKFGWMSSQSSPIQIKIHAHLISTNFKVVHTNLYVDWTVLT